MYVLRAAALKLQTRVSHWEYSNDSPSHCFVYNVEETQLRMVRSVRNEDAWEAVQKHLVQTHTAGACKHI